MKKVHKLEKGDYVGIFSSSSPISKEALDKMEKYFLNLGYKCEIAPHTLDTFSFMAGKPEDKVSDLNRLIKDPKIKIIITAMGGDSAIQMLPYMDFELFSKYPKIICGLSDPTSILNAISDKSHIPTFHGLNGYNFGYTEITKFSEVNWWKIISGDFTVPFIFPLDGRLKVLKTGPQVSAPILGGNLSVLCSLIGTPYFPKVKGKILFIEEVFSEFARIDTCLTQLRLSGIFEQIVGLVIGQNYECSDPSEKNPESYEELLLRNFVGYNFPIIYNIPLGHTEDKIALPIGCTCMVDTEHETFSLLDYPFIQ